MVWTTISHPPSPIGLTTISQWILDVLDSPMADNYHLSSWVFFTMWTIWKARNDMVFNNKKSIPLNALHLVKNQCHEFLAASTTNPNEGTQDQINLPSMVQASPVQWRPPCDHFVKINIDAAFDQATGKGFAGIICRDNQGKLLTASSNRFYAFSPLVAEALSLREAASLADNFNLERVIFESDNKILIEVCKGRSIRKEIQGVVDDIISLSSNLQSSDFTWIKREANHCAHTIAALARDNLLQGSWCLRPPALLRRAIVRDAQALWR